MRILLVAVSSPTRMTGVHRHALNLAHALLQHGQEVDLVIGPWQLECTSDRELLDNPNFTLQVPNLKPGTLARNAWHCFSLPKLINSSGADVVHFTYPVPFVKTLIFRPTVVTVHDLYPFEIPANFGRVKAIFNRAVLRQCTRHVDCIAAVSNHTASVLRSFLPALAKKVIHIPNAILPCAGPAGCAPFPDWRGYPFFLCVAQHRRNKNLGLLLRAFRRLTRCGELPENTRLIIVGVEGPESKKLRRLVCECELLEQVVFLAGLPELELQWCYRNATMLVAPSLTEGFGFPVAEALLNGCRFVCSDIAAFRELCPDHPHSFSLKGDAEANLAEAIVDALHAGVPAPVVLERLSPDCVAEQHIRLYLDLVLRQVSIPSLPTPRKAL